jgi:hypothetical protein
MYRLIEFYYTTIFKILQAPDFFNLANFRLNSNTRNFAIAYNKIIPIAPINIDENHPEFSQTGLKKQSLIRADKIATVSESIFQKQLEILPTDIQILVQEALKKALGIF